MIKYRGQFRVFMPLDNKGNSTENTDDTYLQSRQVEIYRYRSELLAIMFKSNGYCNNRLKDFNEAGVQLTILQNGDDERVYTFKESDFDKVAKILKLTTKGKNKSPVVKANKKKRELSEEQLKVLRERLERMRNNKVKK